MRLELKVVKTAFGGDGIASVSGKTCFVEGALPGETVLAEVFQEKKNYLKARTVQVLVASPERREPPCRYYASCGGCQYQHFSYEEELRQKENQVIEALGKVSPMVRSPKDYGYRNSVTLHPSLQDEKNPQRLAFVGRDNVSKVVVNECLLADERLQGVFPLKWRVPRGTEGLRFKLSEKGDVVPDIDARFYRAALSGQSFLAHSRGFFQNNLAVTELLAARLSEWIQARPPEVFFDLFAGVGTFSFLCAGTAPKVVCVEESKESVEALRMNREEKKRLGLEIVEGRVENVFPALFEKEKKERNLVLLDPPRQGLSPHLAHFLGDRKDIQTLIYVSCDVPTLARDLKILTSQGRFRVEEAVPFDMFPRTKHIETAVLLTSIQG